MAPDKDTDIFPYFLDLPKEIQLSIWEAAVRPVPGDRHVHRFSVAGFPLRHTDRKHLQLQRITDINPRPVCCSSFTLPSDDVDGNPNDSVYLLDSGLWTACKDSRDAMEKRFKKNEWWSHIKSPYHPKFTAMPGQYLCQKGTTHTASYKDYDGVVRHITISYERDLVHLDPRHLCNVQNIDWFHMSNDIFDLPVFDKRSEDEPIVKPSFVGENIALDYDGSIFDTFTSKKLHFRGKELETRSMDLLDMCLFLCNTAQRTIWFIDYGLVPNPNVAADNKDGLESGARTHGNLRMMREVFRSHDCIYTEVKIEDIGISWHLGDYDKALDGENHHAFDMFSIFEGPWELEDPSKLRVLACQPAPGRSARPRKPWAVRCHGHSSCQLCNAEKPVPRVRPSTIKKEGSESSTSISDSDLNFFD
ncbi:glutathione s-transferase omega 2 [Fusarium longipes]|uniref:Glutathione s-transferase omega 2 n=1 Tax=Fusarium longipes TaxID=694270 RepID=A0A395RI41_9HYPO|nr:glutathione s-transferase omega 2 [Fusarium longipes]